MSSRATLIAGGIFILFGIAVLIGDFLIIRNTVSFLSNSVKANGNVVAMVQTVYFDKAGSHYTYAPQVSFVDNFGLPTTFTSNVSNNPPAYHVGEKVPVLYDKNNHQNAKINTFFQLWLGPIIMSFFGIIFVLAGLLVIIKQEKFDKLKKDLLARGTKVSAKVISIETSNIRTGVSYGNRLPSRVYQIKAQWLNPTDNKVYIFTSEDLSYNPGDIINGKDIGVYIDLSNPKRYYVDVSNLPQIAN